MAMISRLKPIAPLQHRTAIRQRADDTLPQRKGREKPEPMVPEVRPDGALPPAIGMRLRRETEVVPSSEDVRRHGRCAVAAGVTIRGDRDMLRAWALFPQCGKRFGSAEERSGALFPASRGDAISRCKSAGFPTQGGVLQQSCDL